MIKLLISGIKSSVTENIISVLSLIILIGISVNCFNFSFYGFKESQRMRRVAEGTYTYTIEFSSNAEAQKLNSILKRYAHSIERAYLVTDEYSDDLQISFCGTYDVTIGESRLEKGKIIIGEKLRQEGKTIGDTVVVNGQAFDIIGIRNSCEYDEIHIDSVDSSFLITGISITFKNSPRASLVNNLLSDIGTEFNIENVLTPDVNNELADYGYLVKRSFISLFIVVCNTAFIIFYFIYKKEKEIQIFSACGGNNSQIISHFAFEFIMYLFIGALIGTCIFFLIFLTNMSGNYELTITDIILSIALNIVICIFPAVLILTVAVKSIKNRR